MRRCSLLAGLAACNAGGGPPGEAPSGPTPWTCPDDASAEVLGRVDDPRVVEASGLAASRVHPGHLWTHNDSGGSATLLRLTAEGRVAAAVTVPDVRPVDWEDLAARPWGDGEALLVGDIGDNGRSREAVGLLVVDPDAPAATRAVRWTYGDGLAHDAEALAYDPVEDGMLVVTKALDGRSQVFAAPGVDAEEVLDEVGTLSLGVPPLDDGDRLVTAADVSPDGAWIAVRTYLRVHVWPRAPGVSVAEALTGAPCTLTHTAEPQGETVAWTDGGLVTLSEGVGQPLYRFGWP